MKVTVEVQWVRSILHTLQGPNWLWSTWSAVNCFCEMPPNLTAWFPREYSTTRLSTMTQAAHHSLQILLVRLRLESLVFLSAHSEWRALANETDTGNTRSASSVSRVCELSFASIHTSWSLTLSDHLPYLITVHFHALRACHAAVHSSHIPATLLKLQRRKAQACVQHSSLHTLEIAIKMQELRRHHWVTDNSQEWQCVHLAWIYLICAGTLPILA